MMATKAKRKIKNNKTYDIDGHKFRTKPIHDLYCELKEAQSDGLISSFYLPDISNNKHSKFKAQKCAIDGYTFDSIMEGRFYYYLLQRKKKKEIKSIKLQPEFTLQDGFSKNNKKIRPIKYRSDFLVTYPNGEQIVYDVKGKKTADFALKEKMFNYRYRELELRCVKYTKKEGWHTVGK